MAFPLVAITGDAKWKSIQIPHCAGWTINPTNDVQQFVTNKTAGKRGRRPGVIDATGTIRTLSTDGAAPYLPGQIGRADLYPNLSTNPAWVLQDVIIMNYSFDVNIETGALEAVNANWGFAGKDDATGGSIVAPDGTNWNLASLGP